LDACPHVHPGILESLHAKCVSGRTRNC
jgi:hypothetical protein